MRNTRKCPGVKYTQGSLSWTACALGHLSLGQVCIWVQRGLSLSLRREYPPVHTPHCRVIYCGDIQSWALSGDWIRDGAEITVDAKDPHPVVLRSRHMWPGGCWALSTYSGRGGCWTPSCPLIHALQKVLAEPVACIYQVLEQLVSLNWKEQLFICFLSWNESPL